MVTTLGTAVLFSLMPWCSLSAPLFRSTPFTEVVLAVATADLVPVPALHGQLLGEPIADSIGGVTAQRFRVLDTAGDVAGLKAGESFLAVPWGYDESCKPLAWEGDRVPAGSEALFLFFQFRPNRSDELVVDVLGWHGPYPFGEFLKYESPVALRTDPTEWLSAREYFALVNALPTRPSPDRRSMSNLAQTIQRVFEDGDPRWSVAFPGTEILRRIHR